MIQHLSGRLENHTNELHQCLGHASMFCNTSCVQPAIMNADAYFTAVPKLVPGGRFKACCLTNTAITGVTYGNSPILSSTIYMDRD